MQKCQGPGAGGRGGGGGDGVQQRHPGSTEKETTVGWQREGKAGKGEATRSPLLGGGEALFTLNLSARINDQKPRE